MPHRFPPAPEAVTRAHVRTALAWAWATPKGSRTLAQNELINVLGEVLAGHPKELGALYDRRAAQISGLSLNAWLEAFNRDRSSHYRNFNAACGRIAAEYNLGRTGDQHTLTVKLRA